MSKLTIPANYRSLLDYKQTEQAIKTLKDFMEQNLASELRLSRITAPIFVLKGTGLNDDLNGIERPVRFPIKDMNEQTAEIVHSLAKWKRTILAKYNIAPSYGIYTDMNAIRADEELDNLHSIYVDQWDWEQHICLENRTLDYLKATVNRIFSVLKRLEFHLQELYPCLSPTLPDNIHFIHSEDLLAMYPNLSSKERENRITEQYGAVFIIGIGNPLADGQPHDKRAPDYDDYSTPTSSNHYGLNGDILLWNQTLNQALEISSMGIRVTPESLLYQLRQQDKLERQELMFHQMLLNNQLPNSIGGGIGQSRLCMHFLRKAHIGEIQASIWPPEMIDTCRKNNIPLL